MGYETGNMIGLPDSDRSIVLPAGQTAVAVDGGRYHTCAILGSGGVKVNETSTCTTCNRGVTVFRGLGRRGAASSLPPNFTSVFHASYIQVVRIFIFV